VHLAPTYAGLPDGIFEKIQFWYILADLGMETFVYFMGVWYIVRPFGILFVHLVCILFVHLVYCSVICYIVWPFSILFGHLVYCLAIRYIGTICGL
jgi:hypothetical protein